MVLATLTGINGQFSYLVSAPFGTVLTHSHFIACTSTYHVCEPNRPEGKGSLYFAAHFPSSQKFKYEYEPNHYTKENHYEEKN